MSILRSLSVVSLALVFPCASSAAQRTKLNVPLTSGDVRHFVVSPDGSRAVYSAKRSPETFVALFSVGIEDATSKLLDPGRTTNNFEVGGAGRVVYVRTEPIELCSVPIDGSAAPIVLAAVGAFRLGSGGHRVVFLDAAGLWVVPTDGSAAPALLEAQPTPHRFHSINVTPDGSHVLYVYEDFGPSGQGPLHAARLDRSTLPVVLNDGTSECTLGSSFIGSPDGKWVVFRSGGLQSFNRRLFVVPVDGSAPPALLHSTLPGRGFDAFSFGALPLFSPDGKRVVYQVDQDVPGENQLFSAPVDGSAPPVELSAPLPSGGQVVRQQISHDGEQVIYLASQDDAQFFELYVVPILGGTPRKLNPPGEHVLGFELSPDGRHVAYVADPDGPASNQLFLASLVPGQAVILLSDPASSPSAFQFLFDTGGRQIAYLSLLDGSHPYAVKTTGVPWPERLDVPSIAHSSVNGRMHFAAGDSQLLYIADLERDDVFELWASPLEKRGPARR